MNIRHVYYEMNGATDCITSYIAKYFEKVFWTQVGNILESPNNLLFFNLYGSVWMRKKLIPRIEISIFKE